MGTDIVTMLDGINPADFIECSKPGATEKKQSEGTDPKK